MARAEPAEAPRPTAERPRYLSSRPLLFPLCPGEVGSPHYRFENTPCPAHGALAHPVPQRYRSPHPPSRQRGSCVRRGRQPRAGGRALPTDSGGKGGDKFQR